MSRFRDAFGYPFVLMLGDNIYEGPATAEDYRLKFEAPDHDLSRHQGVKFFAVLGNHDDPRQVWYAPFNMNGERYYTFVPPEDLARSRASWKIRFLQRGGTVDRAHLQRGLPFHAGQSTETTFISSDLERHAHTVTHAQATESQRTPETTAPSTSELSGSLRLLCGLLFPVLPVSTGRVGLR